MNDLYPINQDVGAYLDCLLEQLAGRSMPNIDEWLRYCRSVVKRYPVIDQLYFNNTRYVNPYVLVDLISEHLDRDAIVVPGSSGMCSEVTMQAIRVKKGQRILNNQGFGAMGFGLPASIGVCLASGSKPVVCINGDGGFQLNIQELETVARLKLPIKFFILNNEGYGSITNTQRNYFDGFYVASEKSSGLTLPDICRLACAYGLPSIRIQNHDQLKEHIADILGSDGPIICDVVIDPLQIARPRMSSAKLEDGAMISKPLEDLWPFLDRQEFTSNMLE
jgi:acetolactate synthase-1/2/3 large subunit